MDNSQIFSKNDMENAMQKGDTSEFMSSLKDEEYRNYIQKKYELIMQSFKIIDKNHDSNIDFSELVEFLDKNMGVLYTNLGREKI